MNGPTDPLLSYEEAAKYISASKRHFRRRYVDTGKIPIVWIGSRAPRVRLSTLNACLDLVTVKGKAVETV